MSKEKREKLELTIKEAQSIIWEDHEDFEIISDEIYDTRRWVSAHKVIVKNTKTGKFYRSCYEKGLTEQQDQSAYEYDEPIFTEVFQVEKIITVYE